MASKREVIRRVARHLESDVRQFRLAASDLEAILESLPPDRYKGQRVAVERVIAGLKTYAAALEVEIADPDLNSLRSLGRLGEARIALALTAVGTLAAVGGVSVEHIAYRQATDRLGAAQECTNRLIADVAEVDADTQNDAYVDEDGEGLPPDSDGEPITRPPGMSMESWRYYREELREADANRLQELQLELAEWNDPDMGPRHLGANLPRDVEDLETDVAGITDVVDVQRDRDGRSVDEPAGTSPNAESER